MTLYQELQNGYLDSNGLVTPSKNSPPSDNGLLYTGQAIMIMDMLGETDGIPQLMDAMRACQIEPGLFNRHPWPRFKSGQEGPDDYVAIAAVDMHWAQCLLEYGRKHWYSYNNEIPGKWTFKSFLGRFLSLICHSKLCAGEKPNLFLRIAHFVGTYLTTREEAGATSNRLLAQLMIYKLDDHWMSRLEKRLWSANLVKVYGENSINKAVCIYFPSPHPFRGVWK